MALAVYSVHKLMSNACDPVPSDSGLARRIGEPALLCSVPQMRLLWCAPCSCSPKSYGPRTLRRRRTARVHTPQQRFPAHDSGREVSKSTLPGPPSTASNTGRRFVLPSLMMDGRSWTDGEAEAAVSGRGLPPRHAVQNTVGIRSLGPTQACWRSSGLSAQPGSANAPSSSTNTIGWNWPTGVISRAAACFCKVVLRACRTRSRERHCSCSHVLLV